MPNYEYRCTECNHLFELWQNVGAEAPPCPECGAAVKKVFHPPRVIFKGSGFYVTDLRAEKEGKSSSKTEASKGSETAATESKESAPAADSKPAAEPKTETKTEPKTTTAPAAAADAPTPAVATKK